MITLHPHTPMDWWNILVIITAGLQILDLVTTYVGLKLKSMNIPGFQHLKELNPLFEAFNKKKGWGLAKAYYVAFLLKVSLTFIPALLIIYISEWFVLLLIYVMGLTMLAVFCNVSGIIYGTYKEIKRWRRTKKNIKKCREEGHLPCLGCGLDLGTEEHRSMFYKTKEKCMFCDPPKPLNEYYGEEEAQSPEALRTQKLIKNVMTELGMER